MEAQWNTNELDSAAIVTMEQQVLCALGGSRNFTFVKRQLPLHKDHHMSYVHAVLQGSTDISTDANCFRAFRDARKHRKTQHSRVCVTEQV